MHSAWSSNFTPGHIPNENVYICSLQHAQKCSQQHYSLEPHAGKYSSAPRMGWIVPCPAIPGEVLIPRTSERDCASRPGLSEVRRVKRGKWFGPNPVWLVSSGKQETRTQTLQRGDPARTQAEDGHLHAKERGFRRGQPWGRLHLGLSACRTMLYIVFKPFSPIPSWTHSIKLPSLHSRDFSCQGYHWRPHCVAVSNGHSPVFILFDLSAASNTVDHTLHLKLDNLVAYRTAHSLGFPLTMETHSLSLIAGSSSPTWSLTWEYPGLWPLLFSIYVPFLHDHIESNGVKNTIYLLKIYIY